MKTIIAGSRGITEYAIVEEAMRLAAERGIVPTRILSGGARGVDQLGEWWARNHKLPINYYLARWDTYGRRAGYLRNEQMAAHGEALVAVWDGESRGTGHMIDLANAAGLKVFVFNPHDF